MSSCGLWPVVNSPRRSQVGEYFCEHICPSKEIKKKKKKKQEEWAQNMFEEREQTPLLLRKMILRAQPRVFLSEWW